MAFVVVLLSSFDNISENGRGATLLFTTFIQNMRRDLARFTAIYHVFSFPTEKQNTLFLK